MDGAFPCRFSRCLCAAAVQSNLHPFRLWWGLGGGLIAAHGLRHMTRARPSTRMAVVGPVRAGVGGISVCVAGDLPVPVSDAVIPGVHRDGQRPRAGCGAGLAHGSPQPERAVYVWYQTEHGRPVPWGLNDPMPETLLKNRLTATLIRFEAHRSASSAQAARTDLVVGARALARKDTVTLCCMKNSTRGSSWSRSKRCSRGCLVRRAVTPRTVCRCTPFRRVLR